MKSIISAVGVFTLLLLTSSSIWASACSATNVGNGGSCCVNSQCTSGICGCGGKCGTTPCGNS